MSILATPVITWDSEDPNEWDPIDTREFDSLEQAADEVWAVDFDTVLMTGHSPIEEGSIVVGFEYD